MPEPLDFRDPFEDCQWLPARDLFRRLGFTPLAPAEVDDFQLRGRLWELIYALAGRRFYLHHTNHLSDRELYTWLHDNWLPEQVADIEPEAEWNCHIDVTESDTGKDPSIWLRYFANDEEREDWLAQFPADVLPAHEDPAYDRDRFLPGPPGVMADVADEDDGFLFDDDADPLGLAAVDAEIAAAKSESLTVTTEIEQAGEWQRPIDELKRSGAGLLPPDELTDETVPAKLWELLHALCCRGFYVLSTDHLSDRELYGDLWRHGLREEAQLPGRSRTGGWFHDIIGGGDDKDIGLWLRYYAKDEERDQYARDYPKALMPPREALPYKRDWRLPKGPF
jgi:hypothetical protein